MQSCAIYLLEIPKVERTGQPSLFQAPREKSTGEDEETKTRGTGGEKKAGKKRSL